MKTMKNFMAVALSMAFMFMLTSASAQDQEEKKCDRHEKGNFEVGNVKVETSDNDTMVIYIHKGSHGHGTNWGTVPFCGSKKGHYNGHWAGVDFGWNGFTDKDFSMSFPPENNYLDQNTARSMMVNLNPFELNVNLIGDKFGFTSGLGFQLSNYFFERDYTLYSEEDVLEPLTIIDQDGNVVNTKKNKLFVSYLTLPVMFEFQTNNEHDINSFHISAGVIGGLRLQSYQKQELTEWDQTLYQIDPNGNFISSFEADHAKRRIHDSYYLNPFKLDATVRIGWSYLNFFTTYSLTPMFKDGKAPELYPWTVGITLVGW